MICVCGEGGVLEGVSSEGVSSSVLAHNLALKISLPVASYTPGRLQGQEGRVIEERCCNKDPK